MRTVTVDGSFWGTRLLKIAEILPLLRKREVFLRNLTPRRVGNALRSLAAYLAHRPDWVRYPVHLKIDVAPSCQLRCPVCPHGGTPLARPASPARLMTLATFRKIVDDTHAHTLALSLYNLGEPLLNPHLPEMIRYASDRGLNTYITTNLSLPLKPERVDLLVQSGLRLLIVAIDGITPETFGRERIGGRLDWIAANIEAIVAAKKRLNVASCKICIQFLVFNHNRHEIAAVRRQAALWETDELHVIEATTRPWAESARARSGFNPLPDRARPRCAWPFFSSVIYSTGDVVGCCKYRIDDVPLRGTATRAMGNVNAQSFGDVYRAGPYRLARRMALSPAKAGRIDDHFCTGCAALYADEVVAQRPVEPVLQGGGGAVSHPA